MRHRKPPVPVIGSFDRYLPMTLAYEWMDFRKLYDKTRYAMGADLFLGLSGRFEQDWDIQEENHEKTGMGYKRRKGSLPVS